MRTTFFLLLVFVLVLLHSCNRVDQKGHASIHKNKIANVEFKTLFDKDSLKENPFTFLDFVLTHGNSNNAFDNVVISRDNFPLGWVEKEHLDSLVKLADSKRKCKCFFNYYYSGIPKKTDFAELGGYAIEFVNSFRLNRKVSFGLYSCPLTNKNEVELIRNWWKKFKK